MSFRADRRHTRYELHHRRPPAAGRAGFGARVEPHRRELHVHCFGRSGIGEGAVRLWLGPPLLQALGVTTKHAPHARRLLMRATERVARVDRSFVGFELHKPARRGGTWALTARRRLSSGR